MKNVRLGGPHKYMMDKQELLDAFTRGEAIDTQHYGPMIIGNIMRKDDQDDAFILTGHNPFGPSGNMTYLVVVVEDKPNELIESAKKSVDEALKVIFKTDSPSNHPNGAWFKTPLGQIHGYLTEAKISLDLLSAKPGTTEEQDIDDAILNAAEIVGAPVLDRSKLEALASEISALQNRLKEKDILRPIG